MKRIAVFFLIGLLTSCTGLPEHVTPVKPFEVERYMGKWYEIARLDHRFERGLTRVTAEYRLQPDGTVNITNTGYFKKNNETRKATGVAKFVNKMDEGYLKVSFFGPFYGSYIVFGLDQHNYQHAFVSSYNNDYLWLLSRSPEVSRDLKDRFIQNAQKLGFKTDQLIWVEH